MHFSCNLISLSSRRLSIVCANHPQYNRVGRSTLLWRHNERDCASNHQLRDCLLNRLFRRRSKKRSKLRVTGLCAGIHRSPVNSPHKWPVTRKMFPFDDVIMIRSQLTGLGAIGQTLRNLKSRCMWNEVMICTRIYVDDMCICIGSANIFLRVSTYLNMFSRKLPWHKNW